MSNTTPTTRASSLNPKGPITRQVAGYYRDADWCWWTINPQHGWVPVASNARGLLAALAEEVQP